VTAGYSGTPLDRKLGIKAGHRVLVEGGRLPIDVPLVSDGPVDVAVVYVTERAQLEAAWDRLTSMLVADGALWVAWPKKASKVPTDVTEDTIRSLALASGLVDVKVCAIDDVWSGLKLVIPVAQRG
jgi:hypothetical protein